MLNAHWSVATKETGINGYIVIAQFFRREDAERFIYALLTDSANMDSPIYGKYRGDGGETPGNVKLTRGSMQPMA